MSGFAGFRIERTSTAQQVAAGLTDMILSGALAPGAPLRESAIAASLGVSRGTVREAVSILEQGALIRRELHRGAVVIKPSAEGLRELYNARRPLELAAAREEASEEALQLMEMAFSRLAAAAESGEPQEIVATDLAFHGSIVALLGSTKIDSFYRQLATELQFHLVVLWVSDRWYERPQEVVEEHRVILEAVASGDTDAALREISHHIDANARRLALLLGA